MGRLKKQPEDCAERSINYRRRLKNHTAISKPREKKRKPSVRGWRKQDPSLRMHKRKLRRRRSRNVGHAISSRKCRHRKKIALPSSCARRLPISQTKLLLLKRGVQPQKNKRTKPMR